MASTSELSARRSHYQEEAMRLARRLRGQREKELRQRSFFRHLLEQGTMQATWTLEWIIRGTVFKHPDCSLLYDCMVMPESIHKALGEPELNDILRSARQENCLATLHWLISAAQSGEPEILDLQKLVHEEMRQMTLGHRRALARRIVPVEMDKLLCDPDEGVISNLLKHSKITEEHVLRICSKRPTTQAALNAVMRSERWLQRYRVKLALAQNPYLYVPYALNLLAYLKQPDLKHIMGQPSNPLVLRDGALLFLRIASQSEDWP